MKNIYFYISYLSITLSILFMKIKLILKIINKNLSINIIKYWILLIIIWKYNNKKKLE